MAHIEHRLNTKASVAGGGAGTFLLALADRIPAAYPLLKSTMIYISPAASVALAAIWVIAAAWLRRRKRRSDMNAIIAEAREMCVTVCNDPAASVEHKEKARKNLEEFEALSMELLKDEAEVVRAQLRVIR